VNRHLKIAVAAVLPVLLAAGCSDFLKCSECVTDPNNPTASTVNQRFISVESNFWEYSNGDVDRLVSMWMQSMAGTDRQYQSLGIYQITQSGEDGEFQRPYGGGGLIDIRYIKDQEDAAGDQIYVGVAQVYEAMFFQMTADIWGDIPYSQAAKPDSFKTPVFDAQQDVYNHLLALLDSAITNLNSGNGVGPGAVDLVYGKYSQSDQVAAWTALAHTIKARIYMHMAEMNPSTAYAAALAEAAQGVGMESGDNSQDYVIPYTSNANEDNNWYQFIVEQRSGYISAGAYMVNLLKASSDPRLTEYYAPATGYTQIYGNEPGTGVTDSTANLSALRLGKGYPQAIVTYNENLLIMAEAQLAGNNAAGALASLNAERAAWADPVFGKVGSWHTSINLAPAASATLNSVMQEKYIALFQNVESWNDYKRTCLPALTPAAGKADLPTRLLYGTTEVQTNPNTPADPIRNWNDPNGCTGP
jgi:hypothetical protein